MSYFKGMPKSIICPRCGAVFLGRNRLHDWADHWHWVCRIADWR